MGQGQALPGRSISPHHLEAYLIHLKNELLKEIGPEERRAIVDFITQYCQNEHQVEVSICILELLENKDSRLIFDALGSFAQKQLSTFIAAGHFIRPKEEALLEAAGELKTRILFQTYADPAASGGVMVAQKLRMLTNSEVLEVLKRAPAPIMAYIMKSITPDRASQLLKQIKGTDSIRYEMVVRTFSQLSRIVGNGEMDVQVEMLCDQVKSNGMDANDVGAFSWLESVINTSDSDIAEEVFQAVAGDPVLGVRLKNATVTVGLLWKLPFNLQIEILGQLSNRDLAVFISELETVEKNHLLGGLPVKRREIIKEELQHSIDAKSDLGKTAIRRAKEVIVGRLKSLKAEGRLGDALDNSVRAA